MPVYAAGLLHRFAAPAQVRPQCSSDEAALSLGDFADDSHAYMV